MTDSTGILQIFSRDPIPGKTKTRLISILGPQGAAKLHIILLKNIINAAIDSNFQVIELWGTSEPDHSLLQDYIKGTTITLRVQAGNNLGERMYHSSRDALDRYEFVVITGSDCPRISVQTLNNAYEIMKNGTDCVLGPAEDGGYYLIGLKNTDITLFSNISWGSSDVADVTHKRMQSLGWQWKDLEYLWDVDGPVDYQRLSKLESFTGFPEIQVN